MRTLDWNQELAGEEPADRWQRWRARLFAARVAVGVTVLLLFGWPLWLVCVVTDAWATRESEEDEDGGERL